MLLHDCKYIFAQYSQLDLDREHTSVGSLHSPPMLASNYSIFCMCLLFQIKDSVCSPGGTTIHGIQKMEAKGTRGAYMDAVLAATERARALNQK